ncbi:MAG TPA: LemA family protein [Rubricoccaceae bacterium]|nr:LemA family protein [Rubricoccaceae bacterium]
MRSTGAIVLLVIVLLVAFAGCYGCSTQRSLVQKDEAVNQAWANVESAYQRRADLIPNLVSTVQGAADFERSTLDAVVEARARATSVTVDADDPASVERFAEAQRALSGALSRLLVVSENYPQLRATEAFRDLQVQLEGTENRINTERTRYNETVRDYNQEVRTFPTSLFAGVLGFERRTPFEADPGAERAPDVNFDFDNDAEGAQ